MTYERPFGDIALSLSGGGYRAATFHLGALHFLNHIGLLRDVRVISTVSGGTLTGMMYAVCVEEQVGFRYFYEKACNFFRKTNVINAALTRMSGPGAAHDSKSLSLIMAAADVYDASELFGGRTFGMLLDSSEPQLSELSFSATEFRTGNWRFSKFCVSGDNQPNSLERRFDYATDQTRATRRVAQRLPEAGRPARR